MRLHADHIDAPDDARRGVLAPAYIALSDAQLEELAARVAAKLREPDADRWLSTKEAAAYIGVHEVTLRRAAAEGKLPFAQGGRGCALRFLRSELDSWLRGEANGLRVDRPDRTVYATSSGQAHRRSRSPRPRT
jgi:excisionase family DNA binding protein